MATSKMVKKNSGTKRMSEQERREVKKAMENKKEMTPAQLAAKRVRMSEQERREMKEEMTPSMRKRIMEMLMPGKRNAVRDTASEEVLRNLDKESMTKEQMMRAIEREKRMAEAEKEAKRLDTPGFKKGGMVTSRGQGRVRTKKSTRIC